jgi:hypothetical protein
MPTTHGLSKTRAYKIWCGIKARCLNKNNQPAYSHYGAKGIKICDRWMDFKNFYDDMGDCPDNYQIDRMNPKGHYEPVNCRWVSVFVQNSENKSNLKIYEMNGVKMNVRAWERKLGFKQGTLRQRIRRGATFYEAVNQGLPVKNKYAGIYLKNEKGRKKKWLAYTNRKGKRIIIGYYKTKKEAYKARTLFLTL